MKHHIKSKFESSMFLQEQESWSHAYSIIPVKIKSGSPVTIKPEPAIIIILQQYKIMMTSMLLLHLSYLNP